MDYGYFPGCSLKSTAKEYDKSVVEMCQRLGISLVEIDDWNCCGSSPAHAVNEEISLALPWVNLSSAESQGLSKILSPCPSCHSHLCSSHSIAGKSEEESRRLSDLTGGFYQGGLQLRHLLDFLCQDVGLDTIKEKATKPLVGVRAVCYYGCLNRLPDVELEDVELPSMMDDVVTALGGEALNWSHATECCGAGMVLHNADPVLRLVHEILEGAKAAEANCIVVVCPLCQSNLDMRQKAVEKKYGDKYDLPVIYLSQMVLMSQGLGLKELGFKKHVVDPRGLLETAFTPSERPKKKKKRRKI